MGVNPSEEHLGRLSRTTFLSFWSYQNPYYKPGKELCDVLIVFGNNVIVLSDKVSQFQVDKPASLAWDRWYRTAIDGSVKQLLRAKQHITQRPKNIFLDAKASSPFPMQLPAPSDMQLFLVAVAKGCGSACLQANGHNSLNLNTNLTDNSAMFSTGTFSHQNHFIHVLSERTIEAIFERFDTTADFVRYLNHKEKTLKGQSWLVEGEENLLSAYLDNQVAPGEYAIPIDDFKAADGSFHVKNTYWENYCLHDRDNSKKHRQESYVVDRLIEHMIGEYIAGQMIISQDKPFSYHEKGLRRIAAESRFSRKIISRGLYDIYLETDTTTFWTSLVRSSDVHGLYYLWMTYPAPETPTPIEEIEEKVNAVLHQYLVVARSKFPEAEMIVGIGLPNRDNSNPSRVIQIFDGSNWSSEDQRMAEHLERSGFTCDFTESTHLIF